MWLVFLFLFLFFFVWSNVAATGQPPNLGIYNKTFCTAYKWCTQYMHSCNLVHSRFVSVFLPVEQPVSFCKRFVAKKCSRSFSHFYTKHFGESAESCLWMAMGDKIIEERRVSLTSINYYFSFMSSTKQIYMYIKQDASLSISFLVRSSKTNSI